jgi:hypothetical protein
MLNAASNTLWCRNKDKQEVPRLRFPTTQAAASKQDADPIELLSQSVAMEYQSMQQERAASVEPEEQVCLV